MHILLDMSTAVNNRFYTVVGCVHNASEWLPMVLADRCFRRSRVRLASTPQTCTARRVAGTDVQVRVVIDSYVFVIDVSADTVHQRAECLIRVGSSQQNRVHSPLPRVCDLLVHVSAPSAEARCSLTLKQSHQINCKCLDRARRMHISLEFLTWFERWFSC